MAAPVSIIIPTYNCAGEIVPLLRAIASVMSEGVIREVIIADGGSDDPIDQIAEATGAELVRSDKGRGAQLAAGAQAAKGDWLLFLHADSVPAHGWLDAIADHISHQGRERAGYFRLRFDADGLAPVLVAAWANFRARFLHLPYGDQGLLIKRGHYEKTGGYEAVPLMEDVLIAKALGRRLRMMDCVIQTDASRYEDEGWLRRGGRNLMLLLRFKLGAQPEKLARSYYSSNS